MLKKEWYAIYVCKHSRRRPNQIFTTPTLWLKCFLQTSHRAIRALRINYNIGVAAQTKHSCRDMVPKSCGHGLPCRLCFCFGCSGITTIGKSEDIRKTSVCKHMQDESEQSVPIGIVLALYMRNRRVSLQDLSFPKSCHRKGEHFMVPGRTEDTPCLLRPIPLSTERSPSTVRHSARSLPMSRSMP